MPDVVVNFQNADPVSGGGKFDRVPEGGYKVKIAKAEQIKTSSDRPALRCTVQIVAGPMKGKKVSDLFVLPRPGVKGDSIFGIQRLHGLMIACGIKRQSGKVPLAKIAKKLTELTCVAEITDATIPESEDRKERVVSSPQAYYAATSKEASGLMKSSKEDDGDEDEDEEEDSDDEGDEDDEDDEGSDDEDEEDEEDEEEEEPAPKKRGKSGKSTKKPAKKSKKSSDDDDEEDESSDEDDDEDLYDDEDEDEDEE